MKSILSVHVGSVKRIVTFILVVATAIAFASCSLFPTVPPQSSGDASFVRQAVPILHGRKIRGHAEVKVLTDLIAASSRETTLRVLMEQPEFIDHWAEVLVDDLRVDREGQMQQSQCYGAPLRVGAPGAALASSILSNPSTVPAPGGDFRMSDVVRSALVLDNLFPVYRAHIYAHVNRPPFTGVAQTDRDSLGAKFGETYLNRQMGCLTCHNSEFSQSGESSGWNRTYPIWGLLEKSLYGASSGESTLNAFAMFRTDARFGSLSPWGMSNCGTFRTTLADDPENVEAHLIEWQGRRFGVHQLQELLGQGYQALKSDGMRRRLPEELQTECNFCSANCSGTTVDIASSANAAPNAAAVKTMLNNSCSSCHGGQSGLFISGDDQWANDLIAQASTGKPGETLVIPGMANASYLIKKLTGEAGISGGQMPAGAPAFSNSQINQIRAWINGLPTLTACSNCATLSCNQIPQDVAGDDALAFLIAARVVDNTWEEVFGSPVTIDNYFPRTFAQRQVLWNLTEYNFVPNDWSIRDLLAQIMTSNFFARKSPATTAEATAYSLPLVSDPWVEADPREPPVTDAGYSTVANPSNHKNAMSDSIYRYSARSLTNSVHKALDWPEPARFPGTSQYPTSDLQRAIGFYFSEQQPGFQVSDFQGLLGWEGVHGICEKPSGVTTDWVDRLASEISDFNSPGSGGGSIAPPGFVPLSVGDVATIMRDWLLGHGTLRTTTPVDGAGSEADAVRSLFGVSDLGASTSTVTDLPGKLRRLCGVQLQSPQFQLAGIADENLGPEPRLRVCNDTGDCSYQQMCQRLAPAVKLVVGGARTRLVCGDGNLSIIQLPDFGDLIIPEGLCLPGVCGRLIRWLPDIYVNPEVLGGRTVNPLTAERQLPSCSIGSASGGFESCGFARAKGRIAKGDTIIASFDGARVVSVGGVRRLPAGAAQYIDVSKGDILARGDLLAVTTQGSLSLNLADGKAVATNAADRPKPGSDQVLMILVSGPTEDPKLDFTKAKNNPRLPLDQIHIMMNSPDRKMGEAGRPLRAADYKGFKYSEEELATEDLRKRGLMPDQLRKPDKRR